MNRIFEKYYFYFLGRFLELFGKHDKSFASFAKVIRFRTFFWDVQSRYVAAYQKSSKNFSIEIRGGIGDFLQHLPFILKNKSARYIVLTHFKGAPSFFKHLNVHVAEYYYYSNKHEFALARNLLKGKRLYICPRALFFKTPPFNTSKMIENKKRRILGVHMGASLIDSYKAIPVKFIEDLINYLLQEDFGIILFGTKEELSKIKILRNKKIIFASDKNVINNLSLVEYCDLLIGSDSVFKTMASMLNKPTVVLHPNTINNFRDRVFIDPYVKEHLMHVFKYTNFNRREMKTALQFVSNVMNSELNNSLGFKN